MRQRRKRQGIEGRGIACKNDLREGKRRITAGVLSISSLIIPGRGFAGCIECEIDYMLSRISASQTHALVIPPTDFPSCREVVTAKWLAESGGLFILSLSETSIETLADMLDISSKHRPNAQTRCTAFHRTGLT